MDMQGARALVPGASKVRIASTARTGPMIGSVEDPIPQESDVGRVGTFKRLDWGGEGTWDVLVLVMDDGQHLFAVNEDCESATEETPTEAPKASEDIAAKHAALFQTLKGMVKPFPENGHGFDNGIFVKCLHPLVEAQLGIPVGQSIPIGWDGQYVRCGPYTWDVEQLAEEIAGGFWEIDATKRMDLNELNDLISFLTICGG